MSNVLVTGGAGFMGSWIVDYLLNEGHDVTAVDDLSGGYKRNVNKDCTFVEGDVRNAELVQKITKNTDIIFHLAAYAAEGQSVFSPIAINDINITSMNNLLVAAVNNGVDKFVFTSSTAVYGNQKPPFEESCLRKPEDPYGAAKTYCENMLEIFSAAYGLKYTIIRPHNVYGPRQNIADSYRNVIGIWINRMMNGKPPIIYGDGEQKRAFSYVEDSTKAIASAGFLKKADGEIINVGSPEVLTINNACKVVLKIMDYDVKPIYMLGRPLEVKYSYTTTEKSERLLGYKNSHNFEQGVDVMIKWARELGPQKQTYLLPLEIEKNAPEVWRNKLM